jgi:hypothetical protein
MHQHATVAAQQFGRPAARVRAFAVPLVVGIGRPCQEWQAGKITQVARSAIVIQQRRRGTGCALMGLDPTERAVDPAQPLTAPKERPRAR